MIMRFLSKRIEEVLRVKFTPEVLEVVNESQLHDKGENSHFKILIVSDAFKNKSLVQRHREVNSSLKEFWDNGVHSISVHAKTLEENTGRIPKSPYCKNK
ncbi:hypothetical protein SteCoe_7784 [Stentor coeruleus]|uniref:BolA-like protein n=1 Tax=Stentor coeruleus TaxID=5963 RepID=A0A1R2CLU5_9CILI|nr:hypothetical protein SteCoe_7784 [Stentor coeruleus]